MFVITTLIIMHLKKEDFAALRYFLLVFTADECKTRWRTIRDSYKKITKKTTGSAAPGRSAGLRVAALPPRPAAPTDTTTKIAATALLPEGRDRYPRRSYDAPGD